ncbi:MAG: type II secretion system F family protein [Candidatus Nealsonbacteria bacterium]|nr:type II secretion system F family protein [Candidatus Nealsonbacteria bacterium]
MPRYSYIAKTLEGEPRSGFLEAKSEHELARVLRKEGSVLISANIEGEISKKKQFAIRLFFLGKVSLVEKMMFTRNLRVMISAGVSLPRALHLLAEQTKNKKFRLALLDVEKEIIRGQGFSVGLAKYPNIFPEFFQSMVKTGEEAGTLEEILEVLNRQMEKEQELKSKVKGALVYPAVIVSAMVIIGILMLVIVIPKLSQTFDELEVELPLTTRMIIAFGNFLARFWYTLPLILLLFFILFKIISKTKTGKSIIDSLILKTPIVGPIIKKTNASHTVRILSSLISSGVPIVRSLEVVSGTLGNIHYKEAILEVARKVEKGSKLAEVLKPYQNIYPILVIQMLEIGEETGETSVILEKLADFFEEEVANATKNLSAIIEPVLMIIIGAAVGFFAISMLQPIYGMLQTL